MRKNLILLLSLCFLISSCSRVIGYGVVLWGVPEENLQDGTIVPVYVKSNVSKTYVIGVPGAKEKIEVPLWKISNPQSKFKARKLAEEYAEYKGRYAQCTLDGLPIRSDKVNNSKQVYRLRKNEVIRPLCEGIGEIPTNGKEKLSGVWLRVLTSNGTMGWCFSHNLKILEMNADGTLAGSDDSVVETEADELLDKVLARRWYPEYFAKMIARKQIDLDFMKASYGFDTGAASGTASIRLPNVEASFPYSGVQKMKGREYVFDKTPFSMIVRSEKSIAIRYIEDDYGHARNFNFISLEDAESVEDLISREKSRRQSLYSSIVNLGPDFRSGNYGLLSFSTNGKFAWNGYSRLVPNVINSREDSGRVSVKYFLPKNFEGSWDGILTFVFNDSEREVNFFCKKEANGLRLGVAHVSKLKDEITGVETAEVSMPANSIVLFFQN